ncbi:MAG: biotin--[acetyl-CoA-carboxylase] ligase, partial [Spirochaetales bacterium]|nr:biotin--[acetyl-CoA-carboxylase] ligase [Spirochaetales bacterium]
QGLPSGSVVMAGHQLAGRGRFPERKWVSAPGESLAFSVFFRLEEEKPLTSSLPLQVGLAVALALEKTFELEPAVKWPNDVYLKNRKVAGILLESRDERLFIGVGVNLGPKSYPKELKKTAVSLAEAGCSVQPEQLLLPVLAELKRWLFSDDWKEELEKRLYLKGKVITLVSGPPNEEASLDGEIIGIEEDGCLLLATGTGETRSFAAGEIRYTPPKKSFFGR